MKDRLQNPKNVVRKAGFTLVEILVVTIVLAVLGSLLFGVISQAREAGRRASCTSNLKQIGLGLLLYSQDHRRYPRTWYGTSAGSPSDSSVNYKWMDALRPYVNNERNFVCPSDTKNPPYRYRDGINYGSYGLNSSYYGRGDRMTAPFGISPTRIRVPSTTVQVLDTVSGTGILSCYIEWEFSPPDIDTTASPRLLSNLEERHAATVNALFCDGHVKALSLDRLAQKNSAGVMTAFTIEDD